MFPALAVLAAIAAGRAVYPRVLEWRQARRRPLGPDGVVVGAAAIELRRENAPAVLLLHGLGDTPQVLSELASHLHARGFSVRVPLLTAHGRSLAELRTASPLSWHSEVTNELLRLRSHHSWVGVVGLSMGGALSIKLAAENVVDALVLLAPYVGVPATVRKLADTSSYWGWLAPYFSSRGEASIRDEGAALRARGHGLLTPAMLRGLRDVADEAWQALPGVRAPTLVLQSREDNRIAPETAEAGFARLGSRQKKFVWISGAGHVISVDFGHERVFELTTRWLEAHRSRSPA